MTDTTTLDLIDRQILALLQEDGSLSVADLADRLGMTAPPCWRRVRRLRHAGILQRQVWIVDPDTIGLHMTVYATVKLNAHDLQATSAFRERVRALPEIVECYILLGSIDVLLKVVVRDIHAYELFFYEKLSQLPGVREVTSSSVMTEVKKTTRLPIPQA